MRYEHWLSAARPSPWPGAVLCLSCDVSWQTRDGNAKRQYATLNRWHIKLCTRVGDEYRVTRSATGTTAESFLDTVRTATLRGKNVWIISERFREVAAVLRLWENLETGRVRTAGKDHRANRPKGSVSGVSSESNPVGKSEGDRLDQSPGARQLSGCVDSHARPARGGQRGDTRSGTGCFIVEDPPIVLKLMVDGGGSEFTWVDAANYGLEIAAIADPTRDGSAGLATFFIRAASTLHSIGRCGWQATAGSQSMHLYRSVFHGTPTLCHTAGDATALERSALFGGRCEPFALGKVGGPCHLLDFRGMYSYLYTTTAVPVRLVGVELAPTLQSLCPQDESTFTIAKVDIECDEPEWPYHDGRETIYPVGRYTTTLCGLELRAAIDRGAVRRVRRCARYQSAIALGGYAQALYAIRQGCDASGDTRLGAYIKRLMNCLHGKFAQRESAWEDKPNAESAWEWAEWYARSKSGEIERWRSIAGRVQKECKGGFSHGTVPAIACAIAAAGRHRLGQAIESAGRENVLYVDTDALIVTGYGLEYLTLAGWVRQGEWGWLQHVEYADECTINGVKRYSIGGRTREAGHAKGDGGVVGGVQDEGRQPGIREQLSRQLPPADWRESHPWQAGPGRYDRQREPGGRVKPIELDEWER